MGNDMFSCNETGLDSYCCNDGCKCDSGYEVHTFAAQPYTETIINNPQTFSRPASALTSSTTATTTGTAAASTTASTSATAAAATATSSDSAAVSSSSGPNAAGIGVGVGVGIGGALLLFALGVFLYWRLRKRRPAAAGAEAGQNELDGERRTGKKFPYNDPPKSGDWQQPPRHEMAQDTHMPPELPVAKGTAHEMPGRGMEQ